MRSIIDRLIGYVNPHAGIVRRFARRQLQRAYEAASPRDTGQSEGQSAIRGSSLTIGHGLYSNIGFCAITVAPISHCQT